MQGFRTIFRIILLFSLVSLVPLDVVAQMGRANRLYSSYQFTKAIPLFLKKARTGNREAMEKLADCYRQTKNYTQAEIWYRKAIESGSSDNLVHLYYGEVLKTNGKIDEAKPHLEIYAKANPGDRKAENLVRSCDLVKEWASQEPLFRVDNIKGLNSPFSEFSGVGFKAGVVFVSDRGKDLVEGQTSGWTQRPFYSVYYTEKKAKKPDEFEEPVSFSKRINTDYHNGPVSFNKDQSLVVFTRVDREEDSTELSINRPKLYFATIKDKNTVISSFPYNSTKYSTAHGALNADATILYFSSDMPGGYGGMDIYSSVKNGDKWEKPVNLGQDVNTNGNEVFPFIDATGILYFSSDGHIGYGGLDIFSSENLNGGFAKVTNLYAPLNSPYDDFGMSFFKPGREGYATSNRPGGIGDDDLYYVFATSPIVTQISGTLMANELDPAASMEVKLINSKGEVVQTTTTDNLGDFKFTNLNPDDNYIVMIQESEVGLKLKDRGERLYGNIRFNDNMPGSRARLVVMNNERVVVRELTANEKGFFKFTKLQADMTVLGTLEEMDDTQLASLKLNSISGTLMKSEGETAANIPVKLVNEKGEVIQTGTTDAKGNFKFEKLSPDANYIVMIDEESGGQNVFGRLKYNNDLPGSKAKIIVVDKNAQPVKELVADKKGFFNYKNLPVDERYLELVEESETKLANLKVTNLSGKLMKAENEPAANIKVKLVDEAGNVVSTGYTDAKGDFKFTKLDPDKDYIVMLDAEDAGLDQKGISSFYGRLRYNDNEPGARAKLEVVNKNNEVVKELVADKRGFFNFENIPSDEKYLGLVYEDDPELNLENTISIVGKILAGPNLDLPVRMVKVTLKTRDGVWVRDILSDNQGFFRFANLKADRDYVVFVNENDPQLRKSAKHVVLGKMLRSGLLDDPEPSRFIAIGGGSGIVMKESTSGEDGFFKFEVLGPDYAALSGVKVEDGKLGISAKPINAEEVIYFDYGKSSLSDEAKARIDKLVADIMTRKFTKVYFDGHADSRSSYGHNILLSEKRAKAVADYAISKGLKRTQVKVQRFGESKLVNKCKDGVHCTDPEHRENRRVEIRVVSDVKPAMAVTQK